MELRFEHRIYYKTTEVVPVEQVAHSLLANARLLREVPEFLTELVPGATFKRIEVGVREVDESSLREVFWGILFITFQDDLAKEVPDLIQKLSGVDVPEQYDTLVTVASAVILFYVTDYVYMRFFEKQSRSIKRQLDGLVEDLAMQLGMPETKIRETLRNKYDASRLRALAKAIINFFMPSKGAKDNYPVEIGKIEVSRDTVAEVPRAIDETKIEKTKYLNFPSVEIEVVKEDLDKRSQWAAIVPEIHEKRLPLRINPPIDTEEIFTKRFLTGDVMAIFEAQSDGVFSPKEVHLTRVDP